MAGPGPRIKYAGGLLLASCDIDSLAWFLSRGGTDRQRPILAILQVRVARNTGVLIIMPGVRMDKWLWAARFFKTRSLAGRACELGRIRFNGQIAKAAREIHVGDKLRVT